MTDLLKKAIAFAKLRHAGQTDDQGVDYCDAHLMPVSMILAQVTTDEEIIAAGILHDVLEDTETTYEELVAEFGVRVAGLVLECTHEGEKDSIGRWFPLLYSRDAIMIKFADRLSNLSRMDTWDKKRKDQYLRKSKFWKSSPTA